MMMTDYHINIFYSTEDEAYIADIPDLKYCSAHGETPQEALSEVLIAKVAWLESAQANNREIPKPRYRPAIYEVGEGDVYAYKATSPSANCSVRKVGGWASSAIRRSPLTIT